MSKYLVKVKQFTANESSLSFIFIYIYWQHIAYVQCLCTSELWFVSFTQGKLHIQTSAVLNKNRLILYLLLLENYSNFY
jgi:hypothetical protein